MQHAGSHPPQRSQLQRRASPLTSLVFASAACASAVEAAGPAAAQWPGCRQGESEKCCQAARASFEAEANGGCPGTNGHDERCKLAESLCEECFNASGGSLQAGAAAGGGEGAALASLGPEALQLRCGMFRAPAPCNGAVADIGLGLVVNAGVLLLVLATAGVAFFDRHLLPPLLRMVRWPVPPAGAPPAPEGGTWPPPPAHAPMQLTELGEEPVGPTADAPADAADPLRLAAALGDAGEHLDGAAPPVPAAPVPVVSGKPVGYWPERLANIWAGRTAFLLVAELAVVLRLAYVVFCAALSVQHSLAMVTLETVACVLPLVWVAMTSRPSKEPQLAWLEAIAFCRFCCRAPRFTIFCVATVAVELQSTASAAWFVAMAPCDVAPWRVIMPYCLGVVVAVVRAYSAVLALRLQDELMHACVRVLPVTGPEKPVVLTKANKDVESTGGLRLRSPQGSQCGAAGGFQRGAGTAQDSTLQVADLDVATKGASPETRAELPPRFLWLWPICWRNVAGISTTDLVVFSEPESQTAEEDAKSRSCSRSAFCKSFRRQPRRWTLLGIGILAVVISAMASLWIFRVFQKGAEPRPPSACVTAQNGTATCEQFTMVGRHLVSHFMGDSVMDLADTEEDCCRGCDDLDTCQAWMFERSARRCRWIRFLEDPCQKSPGDLRCRCLTHFGMAFGFKPTGRLIWLRRSF